MKFVTSISSEAFPTGHYYPFGSIMPGRSFNSSDYRYGFNGQEKDDEIKGVGNSVSFISRMYDPRLGRFLAVDPKVYDFPEWSPYSFAGNNPIAFIDKYGENPVPAWVIRFAVTTILRISSDVTVANKLGKTYDNIAELNERSAVINKEMSMLERGVNPYSQKGGGEYRYR